MSAENKIRLLVTDLCPVDHLLIVDPAAASWIDEETAKLLGGKVLVAPPRLKADVLKRAAVLGYEVEEVDYLADRLDVV